VIAAAGWPCAQRAWSAHSGRARVDGALPTLAELGLTETVSEGVAGGETAARKALRGFLSQSVADDHEGRDDLGQERYSRAVAV
jgi:hypothetical protein